MTPLGWAQMREAVKGGGPWDRIVSSPLQRCALFARELSAQLDIPVSFDKHLQELHFGAWEGQSAAALLANKVLMNARCSAHLAQNAVCVDLQHGYLQQLLAG